MSPILEACIDGKLLWLMVEDSDEFNTVVTNPVERLHLKQFVKTYNNSATHSERALFVSKKDGEDDVVSYTCTRLLKVKLC